MAEVEINTAQNKIYPELIIATNGQNLSQGGSTIFRVRNLGPQQIFTPVNFSVESVASISVQALKDNQPITNELPTDSLGGITKNQTPHSAHEITNAFKNFRLTANNGSGGISNDFRSRMEYQIDARTTVRKILESVRNLKDFDIGKSEPQVIALEIQRKNPGVLGDNDIQAIDDLWKFKQIDVLQRILLGDETPVNWLDSHDIHEVVNTDMQAIKKTLTSTKSDSPLGSFDIPDGLVAVLEGYKGDVEAQTEVGEVTVEVTRDDDKPLFTFDPACLEGNQVFQKLHVHAFENLLIETKTSGAAVDFKQWASISLRKPGTIFKAKVLEFSGNSLPTNFEPSLSEIELIDKLLIRQLARTGIVPLP